jgi:hypothetical protein
MTDTTKPATPELPDVSELLVWAVTDGLLGMSKIMDADLQDALVAYSKRIATLPAATSAATDERELFEAWWARLRAAELARGVGGSPDARFKPMALEAWQAARAQLAAPRAVPRKVYLVATGEIVGGEETYTRHDDAPPPLCDSELLYASAPASQAGRDALDAERYRHLSERRAKWRVQYSYFHGETGWGSVGGAELARLTDRELAALAGTPGALREQQ